MRTAVWKLWNTLYMNCVCDLNAFFAFGSVISLITFCQLPAMWELHWNGTVRISFWWICKRVEEIVRYSKIFGVYYDYNCSKICICRRAVCRTMQTLAKETPPRDGAFNHHYRPTFNPLLVSIHVTIKQACSVLSNVTYNIYELLFGQWSLKS